MSEASIEPSATPSAGPARRPRDPWARFACPRCGKRNKVDSMAVGRDAACARCGRIVKVPSNAAGLCAAPSPVMRSVDASPPVDHSPANPATAWLRESSAHVADRHDAAPAVPVSRKPFQLPTSVMVVLHASVTLGTITAIWLLHARGYLLGFDAARR